MNDLDAMPPAEREAMAAGIEAALAEDAGEGDLTAQLLPETRIVKAHVLVREDAVLCGAPWFDALMEKVDSRIRIDWHHAEGDLMPAYTALYNLQEAKRRRNRWPK